MCRLQIGLYFEMLEMQKVPEKEKKHGLARILLGK
jgi:hypothetical protein